MANTSTRRTVSRPGVSADGSGGTKFVSPFQPPAGLADFDGDIALLDPNAYTLLHVGGYFWRARVPGPTALKEVAAVADSSSGDQIHAINSFLHTQLHPDDFGVAARRLMDPDDGFSTEDYIDLYRAAVTVGTARPFRQSSGSRARRRSRGASSARVSLSGGSGRRSKR